MIQVHEKDDYQIWNFLKKDNQHGIPVRAIWFQAAISITLIISGRFEQVLLYSGFLLQIFTTITVASLFILRQKKQPHPYYKSPFYPILQIIFIGISIWMVFYMIGDRPQESLWGAINLIIGLITYRVSVGMKKSKRGPNRANLEPQVVPAPSKSDFLHRIDKHSSA